jgi:C-terminal processing protease CtpA/Prc
LNEVATKSVPFSQKIDTTTEEYRLSRFKKAALETKEALEELKRQAERIILDLRGNPGC